MYKDNADFWIYYIGFFFNQGNRVINVLDLQHQSKVLSYGQVWESAIIVYCAMPGTGEIHPFLLL